MGIHVAIVLLYFNPLQREAEDSKYNQFHLSPNTFPYTNPPTLPIPFSFSPPKTSHKPYFYNYIPVRIPHRFIFAYLSHHYTWLNYNTPQSIIPQIHCLFLPTSPSKIFLISPLRNFPFKPQHSGPQACFCDYESHYHSHMSMQMSVLRQYKCKSRILTPLWAFQQFLIL